MKALKVVGIVFGLLLALVAASAAYFVATLDGRIKAELVQQVLEQKQRQLRIDELEVVSLWPAVVVRLGRASLSEHGSEQPFATLESARLSVALRPLLSGQVVMGGIEADGLRAALVRRRDGSLNIADLLAPGRNTAPLQLTIADLRLTDARLAWRDEQGGGTGELAFLLGTGPVTFSGDAGEFQLDNAIFSATAAKTTLVVAAARVAGNPQGVSISGLALHMDAATDDTAIRIRLTSSLTMDLSRSTLALETIDGSVDLGHPRLPAKSLHLPVAASIKANLADRTAEARVATRLDGSPVDAGLRLARLSPPVFTFQVDMERLDVDRYLATDKDGKGGGGLPGLQGIDLSGTIRVGELRFANMTARNARLEVRAADGQLRIAPAR